MSIYNDFLTTVISDFRGPWQLLESGDVPNTRALLAQNVEYIAGKVNIPRLGFMAPILTNASTFPTGDSALSMRWWLSQSYSSGLQSYLLYLAGTGSTNVGINRRSLVDGSDLLLYAPAGNPIGAIFDFGGIRAFVATYNSLLQASGPGYVFTPPGIFTWGGTEELFSAPLQYVPTAINTGTGIVTAGTHLIGYTILTGGGLQEQPSPVDSSGVFVPVSITAPGGETIQVTLNPTTWPNGAIQVALLMTVAGGSQYFYVPGATAGVVANISDPVTITINIDDGSLAASGADATPLFLQIAQSQTGVPPFEPSWLGQYSQRMTYIGQDNDGVNTLFVSDQNAYQSITLASNVIYLPGQLPMSCCFTLYGVLYIVGPHWTYAVQDNGGPPVTWASPQLIDGITGTLSPQGVTVNAAQGVAWVADTDGLYLFSGGAYSTRPISYYQKTDWQRINWEGGAGTVQVIDNKDRKKVYVLVPLDGSTSPTHLMTWDYTRGLDCDSANYSLDNLNGYNIGSIAMVQDPVHQHMDTWLGPYTPGENFLSINQGNEPNPWRDNGQAITAIYQTALLPGLMPAPVQHHGAQLRMLGAGNAYIKGQTLDGTYSFSINQVLDYLLPGRVLFRKFHALSEAVSLTFSNQQQPLVASDIDNNFALSQITYYHSPYLIQRP